MNYILLSDKEKDRLGLTGLSLRKQGEMFGIAFWGFHSRCYDPVDNFFYNKWLYKVVDKQKLMVSSIKHSIILEKIKYYHE